VQQSLGALNLITVHLGNGASMAAIKEGGCIDTTMGMTPLEGLVMGTRSGDIDPALPVFLSEQLNMPLKEIDTLLNKKSGLKGLCGANDMRELIEKRDRGEEQAALAFDVYTYRIKKYIGAYYAALGTLDMIVFTAGIGENSPDVREASCRGLENLGIVIDSKRNREQERRTREISAPQSRVRVLVVPTNEELEIARETQMVCKKE
jgi:acetate kinase